MQVFWNTEEYFTFKQKHSLWNGEHPQHISRGRGLVRVSQSDRQIAPQLSPPLVWPNLPSLQCSTEGCSHQHALTTLACAKNSHRLYPNTILCLSSPPLQNYSLIPNLSTATPSLNPFRCAFYCEMEPFSITYSTAGPLFISLVFFFMFLCSLSLSGWELICEAQLLVDCPQRTPGHNRKKKQNKKTLSQI